MLADNFRQILERIESCRIAYDKRHSVSLVAVSKYQNSDDIKALYECGQRVFGENKVQDLRAKSENLKALPIEWHFIGSLQENKINTLLALSPTLIHSIDSIKLAYALEKRLSRDNRKQRALLQVNASQEISKSGVSIESAREIYMQILKECPHIALEGVMSIGANTDDTALVENSFKVTRDIFDSVQNVGAKTLSMGMSGDFEIAIAYGANLLRIGSKLFANTTKG